MNRQLFFKAGRILVCCAVFCQAVWVEMPDGSPFLTYLAKQVEAKMRGGKYRACSGCLATASRTCPACKAVGSCTAATYGSTGNVYCLFTDGGSQDGCFAAASVGSVKECGRLNSWGGCYTEGNAARCGARETVGCQEYSLTTGCGTTGPQCVNGGSANCSACLNTN
jgi:hypothetical protein